MLNKEDIDRSSFRLVAMIMGERVAMHFVGEVGVVSFFYGDEAKKMGSYWELQNSPKCQSLVIFLCCIWNMFIR